MLKFNYTVHFCCFLFLTTAEVLNLIRGTVFIKFQESLKKERRIAITFCCCLFLDTAATGNCNCGAHYLPAA